MAAPTPYNRAFNFANQQAVTPAQPLNASYIEEEFNRIKAALDSLSNNLGILQRADTALANASVGYDQLGQMGLVSLSPSPSLSLPLPGVPRALCPRRS